MCPLIDKRKSEVQNRACISQLYFCEMPCSVTLSLASAARHRSQTFDADPERTNKMKKTFVDVMLELPVDATLRDFLDQARPARARRFSLGRHAGDQPVLVEAVKVWPDTAARDRMTANLMASVQLGDAAGKQAMFERPWWRMVPRWRAWRCAGSDVHRSFWLYVHHPALFERACDFSFWEHHGPQTQQYDLG